MLLAAGGIAEASEAPADLVGVQCTLPDGGLEGLRCAEPDAEALLVGNVAMVQQDLEGPVGSQEPQHLIRVVGGMWVSTVDDLLKR